MGEKIELRYRHVHVNEALKNQGFCTNFIVTSKYTWYSFLPKFLFETFSRVANAYFLMVAALQCIPSISNTGGIPSTLPTIMFIVTIDAIFAVLEDKKRHEADKIANARRIRVLDADARAFRSKTWADVVVGDIIKLENRDSVPADLVILSVSEPEGSPPGGLCYVETKSLDGETNLKLRQAMDCTMESYRRPEDLSELRATVECEQPNTAINKFTGTLELVGGTKEAIQAENILLRGCILRNTDFAHCLVVNTGNDTKIMMSNATCPSKFSSMDASINQYIVALVVILILCCASGATGSVIWNHAYANVWYLNNWDPNMTEEWFIMFFYFFLLMYQFVPISLYVSMTVVKYFQAQFMQWDLQMYHEETDTPATVRTMALNEELGQVSYIFSDKTGTLTCNVMEFRKCSIGGVSYGKGTTEIGIAALIREGKPVPPKLAESGHRMPFVNFDSPELFDDLNGASGEAQRRKIDQFFTHLAVCHTVIPEQKEGSDEVTLSASSPDEQALVAGAAYVGYKFTGRAPGMVKVELNEKVETFEILDVLEFNSTRKRMSIVVRDPDGDIWLHIKGADSSIYPRLAMTSDIDELRRKTTEHMCGYANDGLRTLCIATRKLEKNFFEDWSERYHTALTSIDEIEKRRNGLSNDIDSCMEEVECELTLIGATAVEDKLQEGVPDTIANLAEAKINLWVLTGDKEEAAVNIGFACRVLTDDMQVEILNLDTFPTATTLTAELLRLACEKRKMGDLALVIDGAALEFALTGECRSAFIDASTCCKAVVACRVSPAQKAQIVALIRENVRGVRTVAIGDGANDVAMIQEAHIGIGISGQEGLQAVNASDYAIARFKYLQRLLFVHGRWNYIRMSRLVVYMFYKNIMLSAAQFWYTFASGFSGQKVYLELGFQVYNICFTSMPIVALAVYDYDVSDTMSIKFPKMYYPGPQDMFFNKSVFCIWIASALFESMGICFWTLLAVNNLDLDGRDPGLFLVGAFLLTMVVVIANLKLMLVQLSWHWFTFILYSLSIAFWFAIAYIASYWTLAGGLDWRKMMDGTDSLGVFWLTILALPVVLLSPYMLLKSYRKQFFPEYFHLVREVEKFKLDESLLEWDDRRESIGDKDHEPRRLTSVFANLRSKMSGFAFSTDMNTQSAEASMAIRHQRKSKFNPRTLFKARRQNSR